MSFIVLNSPRRNKKMHAFYDDSVNWHYRPTNYIYVSWFLTDGITELLTFGLKNTLSFYLF